MARKILKGIAIIAGILTAILAVSLLALYVVTDGRLNRIYTVRPEAVRVQTGLEVVERGRQLVRTRGFCSDCHGENLAGQYFDDGPLIGLISVKNLTAGKGGIAREYTDADWVRAIRHGVGRDGKPLLEMPSNFYYEFSDADLGAIIAYLKSLPPVDKELPRKRLGPLARFYLLSMPALLPAEIIDHTGPRPPNPEPGVNAEYGEYLATTCRFCHGENLAGGTEPGAGLNLTPAGNLGNWTEADFIQTIRSGLTPEGKKLNKELMPWNKIGEMSDDELRAIWLYLLELPPVETERDGA